MAYSDFDLRKVRNDFSLRIDEYANLFADVAPAPPSAAFVANLTETTQLAIAINTEKARSEMIIAPVLLELWRQTQAHMSLFSGTEFHVDTAHGLTGYCDYILSRSNAQLTLNAPVVMIVEAKNENIKGGLGQCIAAMVAAQVFNKREGNAIDTLYGAVTTGEIWKFLKLTGQTASIDLRDYYVVREVDQICGILFEGIGLPVLPTPVSPL